MHVRAPVLIIDLNPREAVCHRCRAVTPLGWGLPVGHDGAIVPNWYCGEWAGVPSCQACYEEHSRRSEATDPNRQFP